MQASRGFDNFFDFGLAIEEALLNGLLDEGETIAKKAKAENYSGNSNNLFGKINLSNARFK